MRLLLKLIIKKVSYKDPRQPIFSSEGADLAEEKLNGAGFRKLEN